MLRAPRRNQRKKKALIATQDKLNVLEKANRKLREEHETEKHENFEVAEFLRKEIVKKNERILHLEAQVEEQEQVFQEEKEELKQASMRQMEKAKQQFKNQEFELHKQMQGLTSELRSVKQFKDRKKQVELEMNLLKEENAATKKQQEHQLQELERKYVDQNTKLKKDYEQRLEELKRSAEENIDERLDASVKRILQQNKRMAEELRLHVQQTDELQRQRDSLEEEKIDLSRELEIKTEIEQEFALRGSQQQRQIKKANEKIVSLERTLAQVFEQFNKQRSSNEQQSKQNTHALRTEIGCLKRSLALKTRELKNIRKLSQAVLTQRSDVEAFLISSLEMARREAVEEGQTGTLPPIFARGGAGGSLRRESGNGSAAGGERDLGRFQIEELSWEDREKVLRSLFAKINNQTQQTYLSTLPQHSFKLQTNRGAADDSLWGTAKSEGGHAPLA